MPGCLRLPEKDPVEGDSDGVEAVIEPVDGGPHVTYLGPHVTYLGSHVAHVGVHVAHVGPHAADERDHDGDDGQTGTDDGTDDRLRVAVHIKQFSIPAGTFDRARVLMVGGGAR